MVDRNPSSAVPVVIDEWTVALWADAKISAAAAQRLITAVDAELVTLAATLTATLVARSPTTGAAPRVAIAERARP